MKPSYKLNKETNLKNTKIRNGSRHWTCIVWTAQLTLVTTHYPVTDDTGHPVGQFFAMIFDKHAGKTS